MEETSFLLTLFHGICFLGVGALLGYNYVSHRVKRELKITSVYYFKYSMVVILLIFLMWILIISGGLELEKNHWVLNIVNGLLVILGMYVTGIILLNKHWDKYPDSQL